MTPARTTLRRMTMALAVAYLLVLQALLGGLASGAHAGSLSAVDGFGQVLCLGAHDGPSSPTDPAHHTPDCCTTGCQVGAGAALPPPIGIAVARPAAVRHVQPLLPRPLALAGSGERSPRHIRAPPLA